MAAITMLRKRRRKALRAKAAAHLRDDYKKDARALIASMRSHNSYASDDNRFSENNFRACLRRLRHEFTAKIKGHAIVPGRAP